MDALELQRYFQIDDLLSPETASHIYEKTSELLNSKNYSVRNLVRKMKVKVIVTTDDPADDLKHHKKIKEDGFEVKVLPAFSSRQSNGSFKCYYFQCIYQQAGENICYIHHGLQILP